jgi:hypothetical protein
MKSTPGPNPTRAIFNTSDEKIYNATSRPSEVLKQKYFLLFLKNVLAYYNAGVVVVN